MEGENFFEGKREHVASKKTREWRDTYIKAMDGNRESLKEITEELGNLTAYAEEVYKPILEKALPVLQENISSGNKKEFIKSILGLCGVIFAAGLREGKDSQKIPPIEGE